MGCLALGTVSTDALKGAMGRTGGPGSQKGRKSLRGMPSQNPGLGTLPISAPLSHSSSPVTSPRQLCSVLRGPDPSNWL